MNSYFLKDCVSADISFCDSDCINTKCSRNLKSELFLAFSKRLVPNQYYSVSDFAPMCDDYRTEQSIGFDIDIY